MQLCWGTFPPICMNHESWAQINLIHIDEVDLQTTTVDSDYWFWKLMFEFVVQMANKAITLHSGYCHVNGDVEATNCRGIYITFLEPPLFIGFKELSGQVPSSSLKSYSM